MTAGPVRCERCGEDLVRSYSTTAYSGTAQTFQISPDGVGAVFPLGGMVACSWNCLAILAAMRAGTAGDAVVRMVAERERQVTAEGFSPEHDASMPEGEFATAAVAYTGQHCGEATSYWAGPLGVVAGEPPLIWPWDDEWWKPKNRDRDLVRAGALIAAELDRDPARRTAASGEAF